MKKIYIAFVFLTLLVKAESTPLLDTKLENVSAIIGLRFMQIPPEKITAQEFKLAYHFTDNHAVVLSSGSVFTRSLHFFEVAAPTQFELNYWGIAYQYTLVLPTFIDLAFIAEASTGTLGNSSANSNFISLRPTFQIMVNVLKNLNVNLGYSWQTHFITNFSDTMLHPATCYAQLEFKL